MTYRAYITHKEVRSIDMVTKDNLKVTVLSKGWTLKGIAEHWGISRRHLCTIFRNPKPVHIDAVRGLRKKRGFR